MESNTYEPDPYEAGRYIISRDGNDVGTVKGTRRCQLEGCAGTRLIVQWQDGTRTHPCDQGLRWDGNLWRFAGYGPGAL